MKQQKLSNVRPVGTSERDFLTVLAAKNAPEDCAVAALSFLHGILPAMLSMLDGLMKYETVGRPEVMLELTLAMVEHGMLESTKTVPQIREELEVAHKWDSGCPKDGDEV